MDLVAEGDPEISTNPHWRGIMVRARKAHMVDDHPMTQKELGAKVSCSQVTISKIESGEQDSSDRILDICRVLSIPAPQHFEDEDSRTWSELGRVLRAGNPDQYEAARRLVEALAKPLQLRTDANVDDEEEHSSK